MQVKPSWPGWETGPRIGSGGFGQIYEIHRTEYDISEHAALKVISFPKSEDEIDFMRGEGLDSESIAKQLDSYANQIIQEYKLMIGLRNCPNTVRVDDYRIEKTESGLGCTIYLKMELLTPLLNALDKVETESQIIKFAKDICHALDVCHQKSILHRDIKPQNILIDDDGNWKLGDFGIAKSISKTTKATVAGSFGFMAPEVWYNRPYGTSADIYSLGLVIYWLLNHRRGPFMPLPPSTYTSDEKEESDRLRLIGNTLPPPATGSLNFQKIILKACSYNPKDRYSTAAEMYHDLNLLNINSDSNSKLTNQKEILIEDTPTVKITPPPPRLAKRLISLCLVLFTAIACTSFLISKINYSETDNQPRSSSISDNDTASSLTPNFTFKQEDPTLNNSNDITYETAGANYIFKDNPVFRINGTNPIGTDIIIAQIQKNVQDIDKFQNIIVVSPDGDSAIFSTSYLSYIKNAPVLYVKDNETKYVLDFIENNLRENGTIYLLGRQNTLHQTFCSNFPECNVVSLYGNIRYDTNIAALTEANIQNQEVILCNTDDDIAGICASAVKQPVMLVGEELTNAQIDFLLSNKCKLVIIGDKMAKNSILAEQILQIDMSPEWIEGTKPSEISTNIANRFFNHPESIVLAYSSNCTNSISAGLFAQTLNAPVMFIEEDSWQYVSDYTEQNKIENVVLYDLK